jgi:hypothetical protein
MYHPQELKALQALLSALPPGKVKETAEIEKALAQCWYLLDGGRVGKMAPHKLIGRMEQVTWEPPLLSFEIERHGGTALGSVYAELQAWTVDVKAGAASLAFGNRKRLVGTRNSPQKIKPIAKELADRIKKGEQDERLKWKSAGEVRILIAGVIPDDAPNQTVSGRRKRLKIALQDELSGDCWEVSPNWTVRRKPQGN